MSLEYDDVESLMANMMPFIAQIEREERNMKQVIVEKFNIDIEFEEDYADLTMVIPEKILGSHPIFKVLTHYDWVHVSPYAEAIIIANRKATEMTMGSQPCFKGINI